MAKISKSAISNFIRTECERRFRLDLEANDANRSNKGMPNKDSFRSITNILQQQGIEWENRKYEELEAVFPDLVLGTKSVNTKKKYKISKLNDLLSRAEKYNFLIEAEFNPGIGFLEAVDLDPTIIDIVEIGDFRPDILQICPISQKDNKILPDGKIFDINNSDVDSKLGIRVIDIKMMAMPTNSYFAEVTLYSMALASWLEHSDYGEKFIVLSNPAVWPGKHSGSKMIALLSEYENRPQEPTLNELLSSFEEDLESVSPALMVPRIKDIFTHELPKVLNSNWKELNWHVNPACKGCDYLGMRWGKDKDKPVDDQYCYSIAKTTSNLSRIPYLNKGARKKLEISSIVSTKELSTTKQNSDVFKSHHQLNHDRVALINRAKSLELDNPFFSNKLGYSALMPKWSDLKIYLIVEFDLSSGLSAAFGVRANWACNEKRLKNKDRDKPSQTYPPKVLAVADKSLEKEWETFKGLLISINKYIELAKEEIQDPTIQIYLWDQVTFEHLKRVVSRHIDKIHQELGLTHLAWLFPSDSIFEHSEYVKTTRPITIINSIAKQLSAFPIPHYYSLLSIAKIYFNEKLEEKFREFKVNDYFQDPLSDHVPTERIHEIWAKMTPENPDIPDWSTQLNILTSTIKTKLWALDSVTQKFNQDLNDDLQTYGFPISKIRKPSIPNVSDFGRAWILHAKLNKEYQKLDHEILMSKPVHQRVSKFESAILESQITDEEFDILLDKNKITKTKSIFAFAVHENSIDSKFKDGDNMVAVSPINNPIFWSTSVDECTDIRKHSKFKPYFTTFSSLTQCKVLVFNRVEKYIVLDFDNIDLLEKLTSEGFIDLKQFLVLDKIVKDFKYKKIEETIKLIGNPPEAYEIPLIHKATGTKRKVRKKDSSPASRAIWKAKKLNVVNDEKSDEFENIKCKLSESKYTLNDSQWIACRSVLYSDFQLIWGPPGTGKSRTLRTTIIALLEQAAANDEKINILITGPTYRAIDNIMLEIIGLYNGDQLPLNYVNIKRITSKYKEPAKGYESFHDTAENGKTIISELKSKTTNIISLPPQQAYNLIKSDSKDDKLYHCELFDVVIVDEASQLDMAELTLILLLLKNKAKIAIAGDPKQLDPIHQAKPPLGLELITGSCFNFYQGVIGINPVNLNINYRSNEWVVKMAYRAKYFRTLSASKESKEMLLDLDAAKISSIKSGWPASLKWSDNYIDILDPAKPIVTCIYDEEGFAQSNELESYFIASLTYMLKQLSEADTENFWNKVLGIVTPHKAQQALISNELSKLYLKDQSLIRDAIDTVERFQGQERDVVFGSYSLSDIESIKDEEEFLLSFNRINVLMSRPKYKLILIVSKQLLNYLATDLDVLKDSYLLKNITLDYCNNSRNLDIPKNNHENISINMRYRSTSD